MSKIGLYKGMSEMNDGPSHARGATKEGENEKPGEEDDEDVGSPDARIHKPLGVLIEIRRRHGFHVQIRH